MAGMRRRTCLASSTLLACGLGAARAAPEFEGTGTWLATVGPADNRARIGLELARDAGGALRARYTIDLLNVYGAALPPLEPDASGRWGVPAYDFWVRHGGDTLQVTGLIDDALEMRRSASLPEPPARPPAPRGPDPLWSVRLGGAIFASAASAAAHGDRVYLGNTDGVMFAVDTRDGSVAWSHAAGRPIHGEATVTDDAVIFACDNGWLVRLNRASGKEVWRYDLGDARVPRVPPNPYVFDYDHCAPRPVLRDGVLYVGAGDGSFHAVDAAAGTRIWRHAAQGKVRASAAVDDAWVVFGTLAGTIHGLDRASGAQRWQFKTGGPVTSTPVFAGAHVIVGDRGSRLNSRRAAVEPEVVRLVDRVDGRGPRSRGLHRLGRPVPRVGVRRRDRAQPLAQPCRRLGAAAPGRHRAPGGRVGVGRTASRAALPAAGGGARRDRAQRRPHRLVLARTRDAGRLPLRPRRGAHRGRRPYSRGGHGRQLVRLRGAAALDASHQHKHQQDQEHQPKAAAGTIAPPAAIRPGGNGSHQQQDHHDQQDRSQTHGRLHFLRLRRDAQIVRRELKGRLSVDRKGRCRRMR
jgi:hypothetical protein